MRILADTEDGTTIIYDTYRRTIDTNSTDISEIYTLLTKAIEEYKESNKIGTHITNPIKKDSYGNLKVRNLYRLVIQS